MRDKHSNLGSLGDFSTDRRVLLIAAIAIVVATASFAGGIGLLKLIRIVTNLAYFGQLDTVVRNPGENELGYFAIVVPAIGGLVIGLMARFGSEKIRGHGIPEAIEAILLGRSKLEAKVAVLKPLSSAISIGTGGPFGAEGPVIMTGGAIGSLIAQSLPVSDDERKTLLVAGAAAGMTTVFGTPIAAIMLAVELLLFEWSPRSFIPVAVAAIVASVERTLWQLPSPLFPYSGDIDISPAALGGWILIGLCAGLLSALLTRLVYASEDAFSKLPIHWMWWPMLGGLVVGAGGMISPDALGVGYDNITRFLAGDIPADSALTLFWVKALIWSVALGSGTSGGVLAPLLIIGGTMGVLLSPVLPSGDPGFWPLLAMAATMGGTMRAPFTATFFAVELTGNTHVLLPLMAACAAAHTVTVLLMKRSILTEKIARRGHHLTREYRVDPFALTRVRDVMTVNVETLQADMTLRRAAAFFTSSAARHASFPVVDSEGHVAGIADPPKILEWRRQGRDRAASLGELLADENIVTAFPDEYLESLMTKLIAANISHLPVVSRSDAKLVGYIGWKDVMGARARQRALEKDRSRMLRLRKLKDTAISEGHLQIAVDGSSRYAEPQVHSANSLRLGSSPISISEPSRDPVKEKSNANRTDETESAMDGQSISGSGNRA